MYQNLTSALMDLNNLQLFLIFVVVGLNPSTEYNITVTPLFKGQFGSIVSRQVTTTGHYIKVLKYKQSSVKAISKHV